jgi:ribonuclease D
VTDAASADLTETAAPTDLEDAGEPDGESHPAAIPLLTPREGVPPVIETPERLRKAAAALAAGTGPVAVDAERASGYRYGQRAYLVQLRRTGSGTHLVDPIAVPDLSVLAEALEGTEWILHAASQDLPCLREIGLSPRALFDTELAGRLLGHHRVGLSALLEEVLGYSLAKEHSAADWSTRPLPEPWLRYAALDVELLVDLRDALEIELREAGKLEWAWEEFDAVRDAPPSPPRVDPWRRTSGMHKVRRPRQLAVVRALWQRRDEVARRRDTSPGRVLPDSAIVAAALAVTPASPDALAGLPAFAGRGARRHLQDWQAAAAAALTLPDSDLPPVTVPSDGPPPPRAWADKDPDAAARLTVAREGLVALAEERHLPVENLVSPDLVRRIAWTPPEPVTAESVTAALTSGGARRWQVALVLTVLVPALQVDAASLPTPSEPTAPEPTAPEPTEPDPAATVVAHATSGPVDSPDGRVVR